MLKLWLERFFALHASDQPGSYASSSPLYLDTAEVVKNGSDHPQLEQHTFSLSSFVGQARFPKSAFLYFVSGFLFGFLRQVCVCAVRVVVLPCFFVTATAVRFPTSANFFVAFFLCHFFPVDQQIVGAPSSRSTYLPRLLHHHLKLLQT